MKKRKMTLAIACMAILAVGTTVFVGCKKESNLISKDETSTISNLDKKMYGEGGGTITINISIGKKDSDGYCKPGWGLCIPKIRRVTLEEICELQEIYAIPKIEDDERIIWQINYSYASEEEKEYIVENLEKDGEFIFLSYDLEFTKEEVFELFEMETPITVSSQTGVISEIDFENKWFSVRFDYKYIEK